MNELVLESAGAAVFYLGQKLFLVKLRGALKEELFSSNIHFLGLLAVASFFFFIASSVKGP